MECQNIFLRWPFFMEWFNDGSQNSDNAISSISIGGGCIHLFGNGLKWSVWLSCFLYRLYIFKISKFFSFINLFPGVIIFLFIKFVWFRIIRPGRKGWMKKKKATIERPYSIRIPVTSPHDSIAAKPRNAGKPANKTAKNGGPQNRKTWIISKVPITARNISFPYPYAARRWLDFWFDTKIPKR